MALGRIGWAPELAPVNRVLADTERAIRAIEVEIEAAEREIRNQQAIIHTKRRALEPYQVAYEAMKKAGLE